MALTYIEYMIEQKEFVEDSSIHNKVSSAFNDVWTCEIEKIREPNYSWKPMKLTEYDIIPVIFDNDNVAAAHVLSLIDLDQPDKSHGRFLGKIMNPERVLKLREMSIKKIIALEYLCVTPNYRKNSYEVSLAPVLTGLSLELFHTLNMDAIVALTRNTRGVNKNLYNLGFDMLESNILFNHEESDLVIYRKSKRPTHNDFSVEKTIRSLWANRKIISNVTYKQYSANY